MSAGNRHLGLKDVLNSLEDRSPGSKAAFLFGFLERAQPAFAETLTEEQAALGVCAQCGAPTTSDVCAFCSLAARARGDDPVATPTAWSSE